MYHVGACMTCSWRLRAEAPGQGELPASQPALMLLLSLRRVGGQLANG